MRQIWIPKAGPPEVLELREAPDPQPGRGEVRVRVQAAGINFADIMGRLGIYPDLPPMPVVVGYEVGGRVDAVGEGVAADWIGRDVSAMTRFGGYSDVICVPQQQALRRPEGMSAEEGAALPVNYITAYMLVVVMGGLRSGETVLVHSAGGGVGIAAVQLAKHLGASVIGTASPGKHPFLSKLGVAHCIDYRSEDFEARVSGRDRRQGRRARARRGGRRVVQEGLPVPRPHGPPGHVRVLGRGYGKEEELGLVPQSCRSDALVPVSPRWR